MAIQKISSSLSYICEAAIDAQYWNDVLDGVAVITGGNASALLVQSKIDKSYEIAALSDVYRRFVETPEGVHYVRELRVLEAPQWNAFADHPTRIPFSDDLIGLTRNCLDTRPDCIALERYAGVRRRLGVRLNSNPVWLDGLTVGFDPRHEIIPEAASRALMPLLPLIARSIELGRTFNALRQRYNAALGVLDRVGIGMAIALEDGQILLSNLEFDRILSTGDGLRPDAARILRCHSADETSRLAHAINKAAATARGEQNIAETLMKVTRPSGQQSLLLDIAPLRDRSGEIDMMLDGALITAIDPVHTKPLPIRNFVKLYDLTKTEAEVCSLLMQGLSLEEISERRERSAATVKNQISAILSKCGVRSRSEMLRLAVRLLPPVQ